MPGVYTTNKFFYKPLQEEEAIVEYNKFHAAFDVVDWRLGLVKCVGDPSPGYSTFADAINTLVGLGGYHALYIPSGNHVAGGVTVPDTISLIPGPGANFTVGTGLNFTINGAFPLNPCRLFTVTGTGVVTINSPLPYFLSEWWGAVRDGITDDSAAWQAALSAADVIGVPVYGLAGIYTLGSAVNLKLNTWIQGRGYKTVFKPTANAPAFTSDVDLSTRSGQKGYAKLLVDLAIDASANANNIDLIYFDRDLHMRLISRVLLLGNALAEQSGLHWYHTNPSARANWCYHNIFESIDFYNLKSEDACVFLEGDGPTVRRANNNQIRNCRFTGYRVAAKIGGIGNFFGPGNAVNLPDDPVKVDNSGGTDFRIIFYDGYDNHVGGNQFEQGSTHVLVKSTGQGTGSFVPGVHLGHNTGLDNKDQVADLAVADGSHYGHAAVYVSGTECTVTGDVTATYPAGRKVWVDCGVDGWRQGTVLTAVFGAPDTTITLTASILTANLATISTTAPYGFRPSMPFASNLAEFNFMRTSRLYLGDVATNYLTKALKGSESIDFPSVPAGGEATFTIAATGVEAGMTAHVSPSTDITGLVIKSARVSAADTITVALYNYTGAPIDFGAITMRWTAFEGN